MDELREARPGRRGVLLLAAGAAVGIGLAGASVLAPVAGDGLATAEIARVNDAAVSREEFERSVQRLAADKRNPLSDEDRAHVLRRIIEEELLIQRGVEMGLVASDRTVRKSIAAAMIQSILAEVDGDVPDEDALQRFFDENRGYFSTPARIRARRIVFGEDGQARAAEAAQALRAGEGFAAVGQRLGDEPVLPLPDALLPIHKLREYLGPTVANVLLTLEPGVPSAPVVTQNGVQILLVEEVEEAAPPRLEDFRRQVEAEYRRREGDRALREYLDWLWDDAEVRLAPDAPR